MKDLGVTKKILGMEILRDGKAGNLTRYVFTIGGCDISWKATLQTIVALSTIEVEYMAITGACKEVI
ncbi:hypothetical protein AAG906_002787 [Vitis piasezkii]